MWLRIKAWLTGGRLVWLKDFDGEVTKRIAYTNAWDELYTYRHPSSRIGYCILLPDGKVSSHRGYVDYWKYVDQKYKRRTKW